MRRLLARNTATGRVYRYSIDGRAHLGASLEDTAYLLRALAVLHEVDGDAFWLEQAADVAKALPAAAAVAEYVRSAAHERHLPAPGAVLVEAFHRLARQTGTSRDRDTAAALAAHLRQAVAIDASDQSTTIAILYELERAAPVRKAYLAGGHVQAEITKLVRAGERAEAEVTVRIAPLWHVNGPRPLQDGLTPTRIEGEGGASVAVAYPPARDVTLRFANGPVVVYEGTLTLGVTIDGTPDPSGASLKLSLQACSDRLCLLPETVRLFR